MMTTITDIVIIANGKYHLMFGEFQMFQGPCPHRSQAQLLEALER